jgi:electron transfer flavoprotein beta subunit
MDIVVCVKRVPDLSEVEVRIGPSGRSIETADLTFGINEWDHFAVEEALRLREAHQGKVTVLTVGGPESEEVLRRALAMGADEAVRIDDPAPESADAYAVARLLRAAIAGMGYDLILTGAVSSDGGSGLVGGMLAEMLDIPQVALGTAVSVTGGMARIRHEVEGGLERLVEVDLPALVTVQTGINEPRYVSIRGIRKVSRVDIPVKTASDLGLPDDVGEAVRVRAGELVRPPQTGSAEMLEGHTDEIVDQLIERLKQRGGL